MEKLLKISNKNEREKDMINIAVIGIGQWGKNHVRVLKESMQFNLKVIVDVKQVNVEKYQQIYQVNTSKDYHSVLSDADIQAVTICTPSDTHYKFVKESLEAGKHVLVEKPLTLCSKEARELKDLAEELDLTLMVGHIFRYNNAIKFIKEKIKHGDLGKIFFMTSNRFGLRVPRNDSGAIFNYAIHDLDILSDVLDIPYPTELSTFGGTFFNNQLEDVAFISTKYHTGTIGQISVSWLTPMKTRNIVVVGEKKSITLNSLSQDLMIYDKGIIPKYSDFGTFTWATREGDILLPKIEKEEPMKLEYADFHDAIEKKKKPVASAEVGVRAIEMVEAAVESMKEKKVINFDDFLKRK